MSEVPVDGTRPGGPGGRRPVEGPPTGEPKIRGWDKEARAARKAVKTVDRQSAVAAAQIAAKARVDAAAVAAQSQLDAARVRAAAEAAAQPGIVGAQADAAVRVTQAQADAEAQVLAARAAAEAAAAPIAAAAAVVGEPRGTVYGAPAAAREQQQQPIIVNVPEQQLIGLGLDDNIEMAYISPDRRQGLRFAMGVAAAILSPQLLQTHGRGRGLPATRGGDALRTLPDGTIKSTLRGAKAVLATVQTISPAWGWADGFLSYFVTGALGQAVTALAQARHRQLSNRDTRRFAIENRQARYMRARQAGQAAQPGRIPPG